MTDEQYAAIQARLDRIEQHMAVVPDLVFLATNPIAQQVIGALRRDAAHRPPQGHAGEVTECARKMVDRLEGMQIPGARSLWDDRR